jgi:Transposase DDE domain
LQNSQPATSVGHLSDRNQLDLRVLHGDGTNTVAKKGGDGLGYSGYKHQKGEKVMAIIDNKGYVVSPLPVAPANEADMVLLPEGLKALKRVAKLTGLVLEGAYLNLDGGFDSKSNRKAIFNAGMIPNIKENPRNRKSPKRGRKRLFNEAIHTLRERVERTFAWEDKFKRVLLRFEHIQQRHYGMKLMAYTLINVRRFCSA